MPFLVPLPVSNYNLPVSKDFHEILGIGGGGGGGGGGEFYLLLPLRTSISFIHAIFP